MPLFKYRGIDKNGNSCEGSREGVSAHEVTQAMTEQGVRISSVAEIGTAPRLIQRRSHLDWRDVELFCSQLHAIAKSNLPLSSSLKALSHDIGNRRLKPIFLGIHKELEKGRSLKEALDKYSDSFPPILVSMIHAGERSGNIVGVLALLTSYSESRLQMKDELQVALAYPILVFVLSIAILGLMMAKVVPVFAEIFQDFGARLPAPTQLSVDMSYFLISHWADILIFSSVLTIILTLFRGYLSHTIGGSYALASIKLRTPVLGKLFKLSSIGKFTHTLGMLLQGHVPLTESLELAAATSGNAVLREEIRKASGKIANGESLASSLEETRLFSHTFCWIVATSVMSSV